MLKKTVSAILTFMLFFSLCPESFAKSYPDIKSGSSTYKAVDYLSDIGVIAGYDDGLFKPEGEITRGEAAALIARSMGYTEDYEIKKLPFSDVKSGYWAERFISFCYENGMINGMTKTTFCPAEKVTYAQMVKMLVCASGLENEAKGAGGKWYDGYISAAKSHKILTNVTEAQSSPESAAKRGDAAILVYNCFKNGLIDELSEEEPAVSPTTAPTASPTASPTPAPTPVVAKKEDVVKTQSVKDGYKFSSVLDYTPEIKASDIDFSGLSEIPKDKKILVTIDAGHNFSGTDIGAHNTEYDIWEQHITWPVAEMLRQKLLKMGFEVVMTRDNYNDNVQGSTLKEALLNRAGIANGEKADLFVSIHCNAGGGKGVETYCYKTGTKAEKLANAVQKNLVSETGLYDRGVKTAGFVVIKETTMPAILVETAFIDTTSDMNFLISRDGQNKLSTAIAKGIREYVLAE